MTVADTEVKLIEEAGLACPQDPLADPHPVILVGSDCSEARLLKHKRFEVLLCIFLTVFSRVHIDNVEAGLVSVHGVENNLQDKDENNLQPKIHGWRRIQARIVKQAKSK